MNCEILHTLYLRCNGDVACNDDAGETVLLGLVRPQLTAWSATSLLANHRYQHIRAALRAGRPPWPTVCERCAFFRPHEPYADFISQREIRKIQIEPALACRLRCPGCSNATQVRVRPAPLSMDLSMYERILRNLRDEHYSVRELEYCGQGEPLMHPSFPAFVRLGHTYFPGTKQRLITSGNFDFATALGEEHVDEVMVSCDGATQASYLRYRIGGDWAEVLQFMRDACASARSGPPFRVVWKYILFEWNDSTAELQAAADLAAEIGVDHLLFVYTHSAGRSQRLTLGNAHDFPVRGARVTTNATPIHYQHSPIPTASIPAPSSPAKIRSER